MAILNVNPTRMALLDLKRRVKSAERGHKLLKDKQDGLMQAFMAIIRDAKRLREDVENKLGNAFHEFLVASAWMKEADIINAMSSPQAEMSLEVKTRNVMSVRLPEFSLHRDGEIKTYGFVGTNSFLDEAIDTLDQAFDLLIQLAQLEKQAEAMAIELETTRRRVNALEHKMIPDLRDTVKYIRLKLDETERAAIIGTMKVKQQIEAQTLVMTSQS